MSSPSEQKLQREPRILVVGSMNMDLVTLTSRMPKAGESLSGHSFMRSMGGKGANQAVAASRLGGKVKMMGMVGSDTFGLHMIEALEVEAVDTRLILKHESAETGVALIILEDSGQNRIIAVPGANGLYTVEELDQNMVEFTHADMLLLQLEIDRSVVRRAIEIAHELSLPIILNPGPAAMVEDDLLQKLEYITPNETEAEMLTGLSVTNVTEAQQAIQLLLHKGVKRVVLTMGEQGVLFMDSNMHQSVHVPAFKVKVVDTVGAGDTFNGALAVKVSQGHTLIEAVTYASAAAAISVTRSGAMPSIPSADEVEAFLAAY